MRASRGQAMKRRSGTPGRCTCCTSPSASGASGTRRPGLGHCPAARLAVAQHGESPHSSGRSPAARAARRRRRQPAAPGGTRPASITAPRPPASHRPEPGARSPRQQQRHFRLSPASLALFRSIVGGLSSRRPLYGASRARPGACGSGGGGAAGPSPRPRAMPSGGSRPPESPRS